MSFLSRYFNNCRGIRSSKFKHVYGLPAKKPHCYDNLKITRNASDANFCAVNPKFLACVIEVGGGGSFIVVPLDEKGRVPHSISKVSELCMKVCVTSYEHDCKSMELKYSNWHIDLSKRIYERSYSSARAYFKTKRKSDGN